MYCAVVENVIWLIYLVDDVHVQLQCNATSCFTPADGRDFGNSRCSELCKISWYFQSTQYDQQVHLCETCSSHVTEHFDFIISVIYKITGNPNKLLICISEALISKACLILPT